MRVAAQVNPAEYGEPEPLALVRVPQRNHAPLTPPSSGSPRGTCCRRRRATVRPSTVVAGPGTASAAQNRVAVDVWYPGTRDRDRMAAPAAMGAGTAATRASWPSRKSQDFWWPDFRACPLQLKRLCADRVSSPAKRAVPNGHTPNAPARESHSCGCMITALKSCPTIELMVVACPWDIYPQYISILCTFFGVWALYTGRPERFPEGSDGVFSWSLGCNC